MDFEAWVREHPDLQSGLVANWYHPDHILQIHDAWERLRTSSTATEPVDELIDRLNGFAVHAGLGLVFLNGRWGIDFEVGHLMDALGIMLINNLTSGRDQIRMCVLADCRRPFLTRDPRANYCCPSALATRSRQKASRKAEREKAGTLIITLAGPSFEAAFYNLNTPENFSKRRSEPRPELGDSRFFVRYSAVQKYTHKCTP